MNSFINYDFDNNIWMRGKEKMSNNRLRNARERLSLSQEYVAKYLGVTRTAVTQMENGNRKISGDELEKLCRLYGISADYALGIKSEMTSSEIFTRSFESLPDNDKMEILNLIEFKKQMALKNKLVSK